MNKSMGRWLCATFALVSVAGCNPSPTPAPPPVPDASAATQAPPVAAATTPEICGDEPCGIVHLPPPPPKVDARSPQQIAAAACRRSDGSWACPKTKAPAMASGGPTSTQCGPACTVGAWYVDPQNTSTCASDGNSCTSATCTGGGIGPCATFGQIVARLGSATPVYPCGQNVVINLLSSQTALTDSIVFEPRMCGGGYAELLGTLQPVGSSFIAGTVTQPSKTIAGTLLTIASFPGAVNQLVFNSTRTSYAFVDSVTTGTASMQQPINAAGLTTPGTGTPTVNVAWATGDTMQLSTLPLANVKVWRPRGGDLASGGSSSAASVGWVQFVEIVDTSGNGSSEYAVVADGIATQAISACRVDTRLQMTAMAGRNTAVGVFGSTMLGGGNVSFSGTITFIGGGFSTGFTNEAAVSKLTSIVVHGSMSDTAGALGISDVYSDGAWSLANVGSANLNTPSWGTYTVQVAAGCTFTNFTGGTWVNGLLTNGTLRVGTLTTAWAFDGGNPNFTGGWSVTPSVLDQVGGLSDPATGAKFTNIN